jgi:hypothetical protein
MANRLDQLFIYVRQFQAKKLNKEEISQRLIGLGYDQKEIDTGFEKLERKTRKVVTEPVNDLLSEIEKYQSSSGSGQKRKIGKNANLIKLEENYEKIRKHMILLSKKGYDTKIVNLKLLKAYTDLLYLQSYYETSIANKLNNSFKNILNEMSSLNKMRAYLEY